MGARPHSASTPARISGQAGAVTTNDDAVAGKVRMLRDHGQAKSTTTMLNIYNCGWIRFSVAS